MAQLVHLHKSVPFLSKRFRIWQPRAASMGLQLRQDAAAGAAVIVVGPGVAAAELQLLQRGAAGATVVSASWLESCMACGQQVPLAQHVLQQQQASVAPSLPSPMAGAAAGVGAPGSSNSTPPRLLKRPLLPSSSSPAKRPQHTPPSTPEDSAGCEQAAAQAAAAGSSSTPAGSADNIARDTAVALKTICGSRQWVPTVHRQQPQQQQATAPAAAPPQQQQQQQQQEQQQQQQQEQQQQQQQQQQQEQAAAASPHPVQQQQRALQHMQLLTPSPTPPPQQQQQQQEPQCALSPSQPQAQPAQAQAQQQPTSPALQQQPLVTPSPSPSPSQQQQHGPPDVLSRSLGWMPPDAIRCVSYNILADQYTKIHASKAFCPERLLAWDHRWPRLTAEISAYAPHILALQEVDSDKWRTVVEPWAASALNMHGIYWTRRRTCSTSSKVSRDGVALLFDAGRFEMVSRCSLRFSDHVPAGDAVTDPGEAAFWEQVAQYDEGAVLALLRCRASGARLAVAVTHLWWDPATPHIKVGQADVLCRCTAEFVAREAGAAGGAAGAGAGAGADGDVVPLLICGDFNSVPTKTRSDRHDVVLEGQPPHVSGMYQLLSTGSLDPEHSHHPSQPRWQRSARAQAAADGAAAASSSHSSGGSSATSGSASAFLSTHGLRLASALAVARGGSEPPITNKHKNFAGCLDYIWASEALQVLGSLSMPYEPLGQLSTDTPEQLHWRYMPNACWPSDHLAVGTVVRLPPPRGGRG